MAKVTCDFEFGESVIVVLRTTVQATIQLPDSYEVVTDHGAFNSEDDALIAVFPDPNEA
jgi:hypothetical protein